MPVSGLNRIDIVLIRSDSIATSSGLITSPSSYLCHSNDQ